MISQTVEYALRAMIHLAALPPGTAQNSETIASATKVPKGYLSKILRDLVVAELINSQRGPSGGFTLASKPSDVSILDVVNAVDPIQRIRHCPLQLKAHGVQLCALHLRMDQALLSMETAFRSTTLAELLRDPNPSVPLCDH